MSRGLSARFFYSVYWIKPQNIPHQVLHPYLLHHHQSSSVFLPYIILEWMHIKVNLDSNCPDLMGLVELLYSSGYEAYDLYKEKKIDREKTDWKSFTDILWAHTEAVKLI